MKEDVRVQDDRLGAGAGRSELVHLGCPSVEGTFRSMKDLRLGGIRKEKT
jgi:hypothetical protein